MTPRNTAKESEHCLVLEVLLDYSFEYKLMQEIIRTWIFFSSLQSPFVKSLQTRNYVSLSGSGNLVLILFKTSCRMCNLLWPVSP